MNYIPVSKVLNHFIVVDDDKTFITATELHTGPADTDNALGGQISMKMI